MGSTKTNGKRGRNRSPVSSTGTEQRDDKIRLEALMDEAPPGTLFKVRYAQSGRLVVCTLSVRLRANRIRLLPGVAATVEVSPYDLARGRVAWRMWRLTPPRDRLGRSRSAARWAATGPRPPWRWRPS